MSFLRQLVDEINRVRENPKSFIDRLEKYKGYFNGDVLKLPNLDYGLKTREGVAPYDECIKYLRTADTAPLLIPSKGLTGMADEMMKVLLKDHTKIGSIDMNALKSKYGTTSGPFSRIIQYGGVTPEQVVIHLLVCDGDKSRRQRETLLNKTSKRIGVASAEHESFSRANIIILVTSFENKNNSDDSENYGGPSFELPKKYEPEPPKKYEPPPKKYEPEPPKKYEPPPKKYEPPPKKYEPPKKEEHSYNQEYHKKVESKTSELPKNEKKPEIEHKNNEGFKSLRDALAKNMAQRDKPSESTKTSEPIKVIKSDAMKSMLEAMNAHFEESNNDSSKPEPLVVVEGGGPPPPGEGGSEVPSFIPPPPPPPPPPPAFDPTKVIKRPNKPPPKKAPQTPSQPQSSNKPSSYVSKGPSLKEQLMKVTLKKIGK